MNLKELKKEFYEKVIELQKERLEIYNSQIEKEEVNSYKCSKEVRNDLSKAETLLIEERYIERIKEIETNLENLIHLFHNQQVDYKLVKIGSLIKVLFMEQNQNEREELLFIFNESLDTLTIDTIKVETVSPNSPIGAELIHKEVGDNFFYKDIEIEIIEIV